MLLFSGLVDELDGDKDALAWVLAHEHSHLLGKVAVLRAPALVLGNFRYTSGCLAAAAAVHDKLTPTPAPAHCVAGRHSAESSVQQLLHTACINLAAGLAGLAAGQWREVQVGFAFQLFIVLSAVCAT